MRGVAVSAVLLGVAAANADIIKPSFEPSSVKGAFVEQFADGWESRWVPSESTKKTPGGGETWSYVGKWNVEESSVLHAIEGDKGLVAKTKAAHHAISAPLKAPLDPKGKPLVVQYEAKFQKGGNCGGGYMKLLDSTVDPKEFSDKSPWVIMFGPDLTCPGTKVHFIFRHQNPVSGEWEEKHLSTPPNPKIDELTKLYTLIVNPDNTFKILIDDEEVSSGSLLESFNPPVNPPKEIDDVDDLKPADWVDEPKIRDADAKKPDDWDESQPFQVIDEEAVMPEGWLEDEPTEIPDPEAVKPEEWDDEEDGDWVAPLVRNSKCEEAPGCGKWKKPMKANPLYKGVWQAPLIDNPAYKGVWKPRLIPNPNYFEDPSPANLHPIGGVGFEIWSMTEDILFDNIYIGQSPDEAKALAKQTFHVKHPIEKKQKDAEIEAEKAAADEPQPLTGVAAFVNNLQEAFVGLKENPTGFVREQVLLFVDMAKEDGPVVAFQRKPEIGAAIALVLLSFFGAIGALFGIVGSAGKPVVKSSKKTDAPSPDDKTGDKAKKDAKLISSEPAPEKDTPVKKRK